MPQLWPDHTRRSPDVPDEHLERPARTCSWNSNPNERSDLGVCGRPAVGMWLVPASLTHPNHEVPCCELHEQLALDWLNENFGKGNVTRHGG